MNRVLKGRSEAHHHFLRPVQGHISSAKLLFLALISAIVPAQATVYYVDSGSGSDSNAGTSTSAPWAHVPGSVGFSGSGWPSALKNGDKVIVKGGSVNNCAVYLGSSGSGDAPNYYNGSSALDSIVIQSGDQFSPQWGTTPAIFDEQFTRLYGFAFNQVVGVTIDGFEIRNINDGEVSFGQGSAGVEVSAASYFTIKRCWIHDCLGHANDHGHGCEGGQVSDHFIFAMNHVGPNIGSKSLETYRFTFGAVTNNFFDGTKYQGDHQCCIASYCTNLDIANNLIYMGPNGGPQAFNGQFQTAGNYNYAGLNVTSCSHCDIWNNIVYANAPATVPPHGVSGLYMYEFDDNNRFFHNTFAQEGDTANDGGGTSIAIAKQSGTGNFNTVFQNNLAYKNADADGNIQFCVVYANQCSGENVQYNVFWGGGSTSENVMSYRSSGSGSDVLSSVSNYNPPTSGHTYANNVQVDPVLVGGTLPSGLDSNYRPNASYFQLTASSPASVTSTGNAISGDSAHGWDHSSGKFSKDILGNTRTSWSMGAYEASSGGQSALVSVTPPSQDFGTITAGATSNLTFTVKNGGSSTVSGTATVAAPFQILSGGSYSLGANQSQVVTVRYAPTASGVANQTVTFTGGSGATATVSGTALPQPPTGLAVK